MPLIPSPLPQNWSVLGPEAPSEMSLGKTLLSSNVRITYGLTLLAVDRELVIPGRCPEEGVCRGTQGPPFVTSALYCYHACPKVTLTLTLTRPSLAGLRTTPGAVQGSGRDRGLVV